jgi:hypothetical protein
MWWLYSWALLFVPATLNKFIPNLQIDKMIDQFLLLGIIPGTKIQITFSWFIISAWIAFFAWLALHALPEARKIIKTQKRINDIDLFSL